MDIIEEKHHVIRDILTDIFRHFKTSLADDYGLTNNYNGVFISSLVQHQLIVWLVELTFCVPVVGSPAANLIMSMCVQEAMQAASLGEHRTYFMVNEAEAAATYIIEMTSDQVNVSVQMMHMTSELTEQGERDTRTDRCRRRLS